MTDDSRRSWTVRVGGLSRAEIIAQLDAAGIRRNVHAETLLADPVFDERPAEDVQIVERSVADLGLHEGGTLAQVYAAASSLGLDLCPADTGPALRLAWLDQNIAPDSILSTGRAPTGSLMVASPVLREGFEHPKDFYLRVIDGEPWLRGFRCDDDFVHSPQDRVAFRMPPTA